MAESKTTPNESPKKSTKKGGRPCKYSSIEELRESRNAYMREYQRKNPDRQKKYLVSRNRKRRVKHAVKKMQEKPDEFFEALEIFIGSASPEHRDRIELMLIEAK